jgi:hypothetical protein
MKQDKPTSLVEREEQLNALMDGELNDVEAQALKVSVDSEAGLAKAIIDAYQLQLALSTLPVEQAPASLRRKLRRIPRQQKALQRPRYFQPRWVLAAALPVCLVLLFWPGESVNREVEIAQGKQELAIALAYLDRANRRAGAEISATINRGFSAPVTRNTVHTLQNQLKINREYEL